MSTSMLEQAVIDAEALKEAAVKNAEQTILEKYSSEIGAAVEALLEQDEEEMDLEADQEAPVDQEDREDVIDQLDMAATEGEELCHCPEADEPIELDLDALMDVAEEAAEEEELDMGMVPDDEEELMEVSSMAGGSVEGGASISEKKKKPKPDFLDLDKDGDKEEPMKQAAMQKESMEVSSDDDEEVELDEVLVTMLEELTVDVKNVPHGLNFHTHPTNQEDEHGLDVALAREQDTAVAEEQKELRDAIKKLQEQVKSQKLELNKRKEDYDNLKSVALEVSKKLEEVNLSNAKLIYTNRVLKSDSLNERQKDKLVEAVSKVGSVEEAKLVFETLKDNMSSGVSNAPKTLNEAVNKNKTLILKSNTENKSTGQSQVNRMKRLAGII